MTNAAQRLHALLVSWAIPQGGQPYMARGWSEGNSVQFWRAQAEAVHLLREVERLLDRLDAKGDDTDTYRGVADRWYAAVFSFDAPWQERSQHAGARLVVDQHALDVLKILGGVAESLRITPTAEGPTAGISEVLDRAANLAREDTAISDQLRRYVLALITEVRAVYSDPDAQTPEYVRSISIELGGALTVMAGHSQEHRSQWATFAQRFLFLYAMPVGIQVTAAEVILQIGR